MKELAFHELMNSDLNTKEGREALERFGNSGTPDEIYEHFKVFLNNHSHFNPSKL
ncbi:MAG: hypothetical protein QQN63_12650 [Nitrosopumilus sp.]